MRITFQIKPNSSHQLLTFGWLIACSSKQTLEIKIFQHKQTNFLITLTTWQLTYPTLRLSVRPHTQPSLVASRAADRKFNNNCNNTKKTPTTTTTSNNNKVWCGSLCWHVCAAVSAVRSVLWISKVRAKEPPTDEWVCERERKERVSTSIIC